MKYKEKYINIKKYSNSRISNRIGARKGSILCIRRSKQCYEFLAGQRVKIKFMKI